MKTNSANQVKYYRHRHRYTVMFFRCLHNNALGNVKYTFYSTAFKSLQFCND